VALRLGFGVDPVVLQRCVNEIVARHEVLRTCFEVIDGTAVQVVTPGLRIPLTVTDLTALPPDQAEHAATSAATDHARQPFDLTRTPLLRTLLLRLGPADFVLSVTVHHAIADGWSMRVFFSELATLYPAFAAGQPSPLPDLPIQYADYTLWQRDYLTGSRLHTQLDYWTTQLHHLPTLELPTDRPRPPVQTFTGATHHFTLPATITNQLRHHAAAAGATPFMALLTGFAALLHRYTNQTDLVLGTYNAGRTRVELEPLIGFFVNTLVLRLDFSDDPTFNQALSRVRDTCLAAYAHQDIPFEKLVETLAPPRDLSRNPLCQIAFQVVSGPAGTETAPDSSLQIERGTANFDVVCSVTLHGEDGASCDLEYTSDLFERGTMERFGRLLVTLLQEATAHPDQPVSRLNLLEDADRVASIERNATAMPYPASSLADLFESRAATSPESTALLLPDGTSWDYGRLRTTAADIASRLKESGVGRGSTVGVLLDRSPWWVAAAIAVARVGAIYLPLDPSVPAKRLAYMAADGGCDVLLSNTEHLVGWTGPDLPVVDVTGAGAADAEPGPPETLGLEDAAYVLYTSGSTGTPKGVAAPLRQVLNRLHWMWRELPWAEREVLAARTPVGFVDSIWELWGALLQGVPTAIVPPGVQADADGLIAVLARTRATRVWLVPSMLRALLSTHPELGRDTREVRRWFVSGEPLSYDLAQRFFAAAPDAELHNIYGTSEVWDATWHHCLPEDTRVPIGRPISNVACFVVDPHGVETPTGVPGELVIGGDGVALEYLNLPALTEQHFGARPDTSPGRVYRTGDQARWTDSGELEFLLRLDNQVKVRGVRVELGDIETALGGLPGTSDVAVAAHEDAAGFTFLTGYVVPAPGSLDDPPTVNDARRYLAGRVPEPVMPTRLVTLDKLPRTTSGKLDRRALPPPPPAEGGGRTQPNGPVESLVQAVWADILGIERIGLDDNFFALGGHSLLATQVVSQLRSLLDTDLPLQTFFETPTVAGLAQTLGKDPRTTRVAELAVRLIALSDEEVAAALAGTAEDEP
jgi:amino acid adenylation domain-containing protein